MKTADSVFGLQDAVGRTVLRSIHGKGRIDGVLLTMTLRQAYRNDSKFDIEAIYTFPLAWAATLLELVVEIGGKRLTGQITGKAEAQQGYEQAIEKGDAAVMVERAGKDLYTLNVGNLKPGEEAVVELRYAQMLPHDHDTLRLTVPTALAPRYGDAVNAGKLQQHQVPQTDLLASQDFSLELELAGAAARGTIRSPSHPIQFASAGDEARVSIAGPALLDRDFVLTVEGLPQSAFAYVGEDPVKPGQYIIAGSFCPKLGDLVRQLPGHPDPATRALLQGLGDEELQTLLRLAGGAGRSVVNLQEGDLRDELERRRQRQQSQSLTLKVLVDCSGSMAGESIAQARAALAVLLEQLNANDRVSYSRFGHYVEHDVTEATACGRRHMAVLRRAFQATDANLGGTELANALDEVVSLPYLRTDCLSQGDADILLITDGEVWDVEGVIARLRHSGHRVHTIGVGAAPAQSLLQELAGATGGGCRMVHPGEDMRVAMTELMQGLRQAVLVQPHFVVDHAWFGGRPMRLHPDRTLLQWGRTSMHPERAPALLLESYQAGVCAKRGGYVEPHIGMHASGVTRVPGDTLARMWAQQMMLETEDEAEARQIALDYRLMSDQTNLLLVHERAEGERASGMPVVAQVPHMLASGWGGVTQVDAQMVRGMQTVTMYCREQYAGLGVPSVWRTSRSQDSAYDKVAKDPLGAGGMDDFEIPAFLRKQDPRIEEVAKQRSYRQHGPERSGWASLLVEFDKAAHKHASFEAALEETLQHCSVEARLAVERDLLEFEHDVPVIWALVLRYWANELCDQVQLGDAGNRLLQATLADISDADQKTSLDEVRRWFAENPVAPK